MAQEKSTKKTQEQFVDELKLINKNITVLGKYVDSASKVKVSCDKCNQIWSASANSLLMGHGCPKCKREISSRKLRLSNSTFLERMQSSQPNIVVLEPYVTSKNKLLCRCSDCGNEWRVSPNRLLRGQGCPECGRKKAAEKHTRSHAEFVESVSCRNPNVRILGTYKGVSTKIKVECLKCDFKWDANPMSILMGHGCKKCGGSCKKTNEEFLQELESIHPSLEPIEKYDGATKKIRIRCNRCRYEWQIQPHDLLRGKGCPKCRLKK